MQNEVVTSGPVTADEEGDIVFDYSAQLSSLSGQAASLGAAGLIQHQCPVLVYISSKPAESLIGGTTCSCLVAAAVIDFRFSLFFSSEYMSVELLQCDQDGVNLGVEAGVLYVRMTPMGLPDKIQYELEETSARQAVEHGIQSYQEKLTTSNKLLYRHARSWWSRVRRMHPHIESRNIRILAEDECGSHRFACCMLSPVTPPRELLSPRFAARFVSLVPLRTDPGLRGGRSDGWRSAFATICRMQGSTEDHALLLCSLLLGWGLDAWVAMGVATEPADDEDEDAPAKESPCSWVVTFEHDADRPAFPTVTFWDAVNGTQFEDVTGAATGEVGSHHFKELHALFNDKVFAVNVQHLTAVTSDGFSRSPAVMSFDLSSERNFQILSFPEAEAAQIMTHPGASLGLRASVNTVDICAQEVQLEEKIKKEFRSWRSEIELQTHYDDKIAVVLQVRAFLIYYSYFCFIADLRSSLPSRRWYHTNGIKL